MAVVDFENERWSSTPQSLEFRHRVALAMIPEGTVLDLGCGDGLLLELLRAKRIEGTGLDVSEEAVRICRGKGFPAEAHALSDTLPYADGAFDTVVLLDVLEHVYDPASLLREAGRVARERVIISVPNFSSLPARLHALRGLVPENNRPNKGHVYWFNHPVLKALAGEAGLRFARIEMNTFFPLTFFEKKVTKILPNLTALSFVAEMHPHAGGGKKR